MVVRQRRQTGIRDRQMKAVFLADQDFSNEVKADEWAKRPKLEKLKESYARLFSPLL